MVIYTQPACATDCILNAAEATNCYYQDSCLCIDQTYLAAARACVQNLCNAADQQLWAQYGNQKCDNVGVFSVFTTTSNAPEATAATAGAASSSVVLVSTTFTNTDGVATATAVVPSSANPANSVVTPSTTPNSSSNTGSGSGGLSVGDIAGVAGAAIGGAALIITFLAWIFPRHTKIIIDRLRGISAAEDSEFLLQ